MRSSLKACHCCGLIQRLPPLTDDQVALCTRCFSRLVRSDGRKSTVRTAAAALAAFLLFWPAVFLPILEIDKPGHHHESSIVGGTIELIRSGNWFVGLIVLLFSVIFPLTKIVLLLELSWLALIKRKHKAMTYQVMEHLGKWSMMDVMLLAFMVMLLKIGDLVTFHFGPAVIAFVFCVGMSMIASICFDPHAIWEEDLESI